MRISIQAVVTGLALAGLASCGSGNVEAAAATSSSAEPGAASSPKATSHGTWTNDPYVLRVSEPFTGDLDGMREREVIRVLVSYSRTNFFLADGQLRGFEVELFRELENELVADRPTGAPPLHFAFLPVSFDELLPSLLEGRGDVAAASLTATPERARTVSFTEPYLTDVDEIVVANANAPRIDAWEDLAGEDILVASGTSYEADLELINEDFAAAGLEPMHIVHGGRGIKTEDVLELVHAGAFRYTVCDRFAAELWAGVLDGLRPEPEVQLRVGGEIAWAVRPESVELKALLDDFARRNAKGTLIGNVLFKRYFGQTRWISNPLLDEDRSRLAPFRAAIERYAEEFGFDWRLIAAQAYQESRLDPNAVSRSGAVGLMQLLPATAKDMGVTDLKDPDRSLYAGVKYMGWLRKNFFDEPQLTAEAQVDFCLAAYNAGPSRVKRWREAAPERGLDPDVWFGNVELLALEDVGMQPVQYVGNINKYFVLYALTMEGMAQRERGLEELETGR
ncbi:MAG: transglycosylase SLT domain-containing protein [Planctomycetota bacterium]